MELLADDSPKIQARKARQEETTRLWERFWASPVDAHRNDLVEAYQGLARSVTGRFAARLPRTVDRGDLSTAGNVGLMNAIVSFDASRGVRFESYGETRIRGALLDELRTQDWLPRPWRQRLEGQKRALERLRAGLGREPRDEEVAAELDMPLETYEALFGVGLPGAPAGSMPNSVGAQETTSDLDVVEDPHADEPAAKLTREELLVLVTQRLSEQESRVVYLKYWEELSMREIGLLLELSESRVCKIHTRLLNRLKDRLGPRD